MYKIATAIAFSSYALAEPLSVMTSEVNGNGALAYDLTIFTDSGFTTPYDAASHSAFKVGNPLYFKVAATNPISRVDFSLLNCVVKNSDETLEYPIIQNFCADSKVGAAVIGDIKSTTALTASYDVFEFISDAKVQATNQVHISCEVLLCDALDNDSTCSSGCVSGRRRRSVDESNLVALRSHEFSLE